MEFWLLPPFVCIASINQADNFHFLTKGIIMTMASTDGKHDFDYDWKKIFPRHDIHPC